MWFSTRQRDKSEQTNVRGKSSKGSAGAYVYLPHEEDDDRLDLIPGGRRSSSDMSEHLCVWVSLGGEEGGGG